MASHCEVCGARAECMLLQRRAERDSADEAKHEPSLKSLKRLWDDSAHAMFSTSRTVADLDFKHTVITVKDTDTVETGMKTLIANHVSSAPVVPAAGGPPLGFLDTADLCAIIVHGHAIDGDVDTDAFSSFRSLLMRAEMHAKKVRDVFGTSHIDPFLPLDEGSPLMQVVCILGDSVASPDGGKALRVHRVPIVNAAGQVTQIVSQSAVLQYLELHHDQLGAVLDAHVRDSCNVGSRDVICAQTSDPVLTTIATMLKHRISGLPVVNKAGVLVGHVSNFDPAAMLAANDHLEFAKMNTGDFAKAAHALRFPEAAHKQKLRRKPLGLAGAVVVHMHDSLAFVLHKMVHEKVHRVFVVNKDKHPVGVISAHDLLRELVVKFEIPTELKSSLYSRARFRPPTGSPQREAREALEERRVAARSAGHGAEDDERKQ